MLTVDVRANWLRGSGAIGSHCLTLSLCNVTTAANRERVSCQSCFVAFEHDGIFPCQVNQHDNTKLVLSQWSWLKNGPSDAMYTPGTVDH